ncbi:MAG: hypothetical protein AAGI68_06105 [Planctomycetota bacterium]
MSVELARRYAWLGVRGAVPADWEVVRHGLHPERGALTWVDRRRQRMVLNWAGCVSEPDVGQLLSDHRQRQLEEDAEAVYRPFSVGGWEGMSRELGEDVAGGEGETRWVSRGVRFDAGSMRLLEVTVLHGAGDEQLLERVLGSMPETVSAGSADAGGDRTVLFGVDCRVLEREGAGRDRSGRFSAGAESDGEAERGGVFWHLVGADVKAGETELLYSDQPKGAKHAGRLEARVRRRGLSGVWFNGDLHRLAERELGESGGELGVETRGCLVRGMPGLEVETMEPGPRLKRWAGRLRVRRDLYWHDERDAAVWRVTTLSFAGGVRGVAGFEAGPAAGAVGWDQIERLGPGLESALPVSEEQGVLV